MGRPRTQMWAWTLCVFMSRLCVQQAVAGPEYMVAIPAVLESGEKTQFCSSLLDPKETMTMTVTLRDKDMNMTLLQMTSSEDFHNCQVFEVPSVEEEKVLLMEVEVKGETFYSKKARKVMIRIYKPSTFIQTDKPIYLPGQTVNFRVVSLDSHLKPASPLYNIIELEDSRGNRIGQWLNETSRSKILQRSYSLNSEAAVGTYSLTVEFGGTKEFHTFKVEKYVFRKFEVTVSSAEEVSIAQEEFEVTVCGKYTYGQPVPGTVIITVCRTVNSFLNYFSNIDGPEITAPCQMEEMQTDKNGCATLTFKMSSFTKLDKKAVRNQLDIIASLEEERTGISLSQEKKMNITYVIGRLSFVDTPKFYEPGATMEGKVRAVHYNNTPMAYMKLYLFEAQTWQAQSLENVTTDSSGFATFSFSTSELEGDLNMYVTDRPQLDHPEHRTAYIEKGQHSVSVAQGPSPDTKTVSSLEVKKKNEKLPCDKEEEIFIKYTVVAEAQGSVDLMYLVLSRGVIVSQGYYKVDVKEETVTEGEVSFKLKVSSKISPEVQVLAYAILPSESVIAHSAEFSTETCFDNKVALKFSPSSAVTGEKSSMELTALPESICGVSAVDRSVLIKEPGQTLDASKILDLLPVKKSIHVPYELRDPDPCLVVRPKRYIRPQLQEEEDPERVFQNVGLKMITNLFTRMPSCLNFGGKTYGECNGRCDHYYTRTRVSEHLLSTKELLDFLPEASPIEKVRTFFPETWIWDLVDVGESGKVVKTYTTPDTITTWETEAFCLSSQGFGLAPREEITVFQPFFLELSLPYSIIRGEHFELKATVFNYLEKCIMVSVIAAQSSDYTLTPLIGNEHSSCLCANQRLTVSWTMVPLVVGDMKVSVTAEAVASDISCNNEIVLLPERGRIDVVTRTLKVKAEGVETTQTYNWLLCPKEASLAEKVEIKLPNNVIEGSVRTSISVLGDIMGRSLQHLDGLLKMPYGNGEQNLALLAPNIYILDYLENTNQLTPEMKKKAIGYLLSGYQRQLNYQNRAGAYTTFGSGPGNSWLTAFVLRTFAKAKKYIYIDPATRQTSETWLSNKQRENGCFEMVGKLYQKGMKGGVSDEVTLTAYLTAGFLEMKISPQDPRMNKSLSCLRGSIHDLNNTYTKALMAYAFTLAGDMDNRNILLNHLDTIAINKGGYLYWDQTSTETSASLSVEISSYVILAKLSASPSSGDLGYAIRIVRWLTTQQNYYGGFSSTQDTVVALQALALYSSLIYSTDGSSTVIVKSATEEFEFMVNNKNKLLFQEKEMKFMAGKYELEATGSTCASVQISFHYNIPTSVKEKPLIVEAKTVSDCGSKVSRPRMTLDLMCLYTGEDESSNMVVLDIKLLSGLSPAPESLKWFLGSHDGIVKHSNDNVLVYILELKKGEPMKYSLHLQQDYCVQNLKPAVVKIYDGYKPSEYNEVEYTYPCAAA